MTLPQFIEVEFTKHGQAFDPAQVRAAVERASQSSDVFVFSHGWNNDIDDARKLYRAFFANAAKLLQEGRVPALAGRELAAVGVLWPSKKFTDDDLIPGGGAASATDAGDAALQRVLEELKRDPERLGRPSKDAARAKEISQAQALVPQLEASEEARREFVLHLRAIVDAGDAHAEDGSDEFFARDPLELFEALAEPVIAPSDAGAGGATGLDDDDEGGAAGLRDLLDGVKAAARRIANFTTYYQMKQRAGLVGRSGVNRLLRDIRKAAPDVRLHLVGHSFGGRVVTAAADALDPGTPAVTVSLLQAAYSHNGLAQRFDGEKDGFFRKLLSQRRASGPILITHTKKDKAVGVAYPLASRIARENAAALGDENDPYGGMGRNGAQRTPEAADHAGDLLEVGGKYEFEPGAVYNLRGGPFIKDHGNVEGREVAYAVLSAAGSL
jgi:pimeloyl-ACP methyl ester carboxylesterase